MNPTTMLIATTTSETAARSRRTWGGEGESEAEENAAQKGVSAALANKRTQNATPREVQAAVPVSPSTKLTANDDWVDFAAALGLRAARLAGTERGVPPSLDDQ